MPFGDWAAWFPAVYPYKSSNEIITYTSIDNTTTSYNYNTYGELKQYVVQYCTSDVFHADYELDDIGWIAGIKEIYHDKNQHIQLSIYDQKSKGLWASLIVLLFTEKDK